MGRKKITPLGNYRTVNLDLPTYELLQRLQLHVSLANGHRPTLSALVGDAVRQAARVAKIAEVA